MPAHARCRFADADHRRIRADIAPSPKPAGQPNQATGALHDQVRWGPIVAGLMIALSTQLVLSAFGAAIGLTSIGDSGAPRTEAPGVGTNIGIWAIISLLLSLFAGGWITGRTSGRMSRNTALLNGAILWASTLALSAWLLSSGVSGAFGVAAANAGNIVNQVQQTAPKYGRGRRVGRQQGHRRSRFSPADAGGLRAVLPPD